MLPETHEKAKYYGFIFREKAWKTAIIAVPKINELSLFCRGEIY